MKCRARKHGYIPEDPIWDHPVRRVVFTALVTVFAIGTVVPAFGAMFGLIHL